MAGGAAFYRAHLHAQRAQVQLAQGFAHGGGAGGEGDGGQAGLLGVVHGQAFVSHATEKAAKQAVAFFAHAADAAQHAVKRHAQRHQRLRGQHQAAFHHFGHHFVGAGFAQQVDVGVIHGAHNHGEVGAQLLHHLQDADRGMGVGIRNHQCLGAHQAGGQQHFFFGGVAKHHGVASGGGLAHPLRVQIEGKHRDGFALQQPRQRLAAAAIAANQHMFAAQHAGHQNMVQIRRLHHPVGANQLAHQPVAARNQKR